MNWKSVFSRAPLGTVLDPVFVLPYVNDLSSLLKLSVLSYVGHFKMQSDGL